ncbi:MAG: NAD(P) transhydrogenase subunit alpha [Verrucomicrobiales bacterium]|jgi:NAD(P) transhydrogenase subunit alpha|nr:NAD(P) transhydrogenase subunit alpha [Verrucomicrobiales bacterium]
MKKKLMLMVLPMVAATALRAAELNVADLAAGDAHAGESADYMSLLFVFLLSTFIGLMVINQVSRLLHTPLMSLTNAISAIAVVGAILVGGRSYVADGELTWINLLGLVAIVASVTNIVSGFLITDRMLKMFKQRGSK